MAIGYDGTIKIDSRINSKGFNTGISKMTNAVKGLALAVGLALSVAAIISFGRSAVNTASEMTNAYIGLKSIVDGTGNSFAKAKEFINDYISDGLVPAADAVTAYKNLLARGYSTDQIEQTLLRLKNAASFGRQSSLTLGQAVRSASEGLKNENSILVDNAGVTKNVSVMWKEYAKKIGVGVQSLTKAQKIQAEVNGIMEETKFQMGDAEKLAGTYSGQVSALGTSFVRLKVAVGNVFIPLLTRMIPVIKIAVNSLTTLIERLALMSSLFFGVSLDVSGTADAIDDTTSSVDGMSDAEAELAKNTDKAAEAAKGALAAFDELNVLAQPDEQKSASDLAEPAVIPPLDTTEADESLETLREKILGFKKTLLDLFAPAIASFDKLIKVIEPIGKKIAAGLGWAWTNILVPFGKWAIESFLPVFFELLAAALRVLDAAITPLKPLLLAFWEDILRPMAIFIGGILIDSMKGWVLLLNDVADWLEEHPDILENMAIAVGRRLREITDGIINFVKNIREKIGSILNEGFATIRSEGIVGVFKRIANGIIDIINGMVAAVYGGINSINTALSSIQGVIPDWVPGLGGQSISLGFFGSPLVPPRIPKLATGAVIPPNSQFLAMLGDQKSGRNIEAPEALIRQIIREEMGSGDITVPVTLTLDGEVVYKNQKRVSRKHGSSLVVGGTV